MHFTCTAAAKTDAKKYATIAPNYAYGKDAVAAFKQALTALKPDVEFVAEPFSESVSALADLVELFFGCVAPFGADAGAEHVSDGFEFVLIPGVGWHGSVLG